MSQNQYFSAVKMIEFKRDLKEEYEINDIKKTSIRVQRLRPLKFPDQW